MKKLVLLFLMLSSVLVLTACGEYDLTSKSVLTDVTIKEINSRMVGKVRKYKIILTKDGVEHTFALTRDDAPYIKEEIDTIKKTSLIVESKEEVLFDVVLDEKEVISVILSKNRN